MLAKPDNWFRPSLLRRHNDRLYALHNRSTIPMQSQENRAHSAQDSAYPPGVAKGLLIS